MHITFQLHNVLRFDSTVAIYEVKQPNIKKFRSMSA